MANGELCRKCQKQETDHELYPEETCETFISEVRHKRNCPVLDCHGDCDAAIAERAWRAQCLENRARNAWFMSGPNGVRLDIGS